jgi:hypothetical protein
MTDIGKGRLISAPAGFTTSWILFQRAEKMFG